MFKLLMVHHSKRFLKSSIPNTAWLDPGVLNTCDKTGTKNDLNLSLVMFSVFIKKSFSTQTLFYL